MNSNLENIKIAVFGDVMLDIYCHGEITRISPEAPVPVFSTTKTEYRLGGAGNVAVNLKSLGVDVSLFGHVGNDTHGDRIQNMLDTLQIKHSLIHTNRTTTKMRYLSQGQQVMRVDQDHKNPPLDAKYQLSGLDAIIISDYGKGSAEACASIISKARDLDIPVLVDPKGKDFSKYRGATLITPNEKEYQEAFGNQPPNEVRKRLYIENLLLTQGERGMTLFMDTGTHKEEASAKAVYDVTGAGDTVIAVMAVCLATGISPEESMILANKSAGLVVGKIGAASVTWQDLYPCDDPYVKIEQARAAGKKIVYTNGCFDLLHAGHIHSLLEAKKHGDFLVVGLNDDESVRRLKGHNRPIVSLGHRQQLLESLGVVDLVIPFSEETPVKMVERIKPDVLVKGGDYAGKTIKSTEHAGKVVLVERQENLSTTNIINKITASLLVK